MFVSSVALLDASLTSRGIEFEPSPCTGDEPDSHLVMVESKMPNGDLLIVNPDTQEVPNAVHFVDAEGWGRMVIPEQQVDRVWHSTRADGTETSRVAIVWRMTSDSA